MSESKKLAKDLHFFFGARVESVRCSESDGGRERNGRGWAASGSGDIDAVGIVERARVSRNGGG